MDVVKAKESLVNLALKISHIQINLKNLRTVLKPISGIHKLSDLQFDV